ncbi:MAG: hypothetical protein PWQ96_414 [Clostridia bacterium]|nr:hypothetical protein [Clostridia bacterium]
METCKLCENPIQTIKSVEEPVYYHCENCDLIFIDKAYYISPQKEKERYEMHDNTIENKGYVKMFEKFIDKAVVPYVKKGEKALDFGSGPQPVLKILLEKRGIATDIYDPYFAPKRVFHNKKYDLITCTEVIEHIKDPLFAWNFFKEHLKPGGKLALMTLFHQGTDNFAEWWYRQDATHACFYSPKTFTWVEKHFSFRILNIDQKNTLTMKLQI